MEVSRRALLGAAVGLPLLPCHPDPESSSGVSGSRSPSPGRATRWTLKRVQGDEAWQATLAAFRGAEAAVGAVEAATAGHGLEAEEALLPAHDAACEAMEAALGRLLLVPTPTPTAFAVKLDLFFEHELEPLSVDEVRLAAIRGDARRLANVTCDCLEAETGSA